MLYPMSAMVLLTFIVACITVKVRFASVKSGRVKAHYFKLMDGQEVPEMVAKTTRHINNHFEVPVLFYVGCSLYISMGVESTLALIVAWLFVASRYLHSYIHLTYNNVFHRMLAFWVGIMSVFVIWANLVIQQM